MNPELPALLVRSVGLLAPLVPLVGLCLWRAPRPRETAGMIVSTSWALLTLIPLNLYAVRVGWWSFHAEGAVWAGLPVDLLLAWALLWGALPALMLRFLPVPLLTALLVWVDIIVMPLAEPVVVLHGTWLMGEFVGSALCLIPALMLAHWTRRRRAVPARVWAQAVLSFGLMVVLPLAVVGVLPGAEVAVPGGVPVALQLFAVAALPGLAAAREFARVGNGTPLPYDPPERLVTSGPYAYLRNPMQTTIVAVYLVLALVFADPRLLVGAAAAFAYGAGFATWHEGDGLRTTFGDDWDHYRRGVRAWIPRRRPWPDRARGTLYVAADCSMCRGLGAWIRARGPIALTLRPAHEHPEVLHRLTYENPDGVRWSGVSALARALDHLNLGWAFLGWALDLPVLRHFAQLCADAFGAGPRPSRVLEPAP
ncbi:methyltransferase [Nocardiopsis sp. N85]|uniref:methyltransferase family protein n=1 Tax=Nocardiopsis sp. N85 TaxID=3029400 RepID=UPI00237F3692|nr:methyltransferase [Nocardiopsis sp. N85]MDE3724384.1 methyltransferase [Nocardiopsis sp. N85]